VSLRIPPLRERRADIFPLADYYLSVFSKKYDKPVKGISGDVRDFFKKHCWPGNVRELRNCIERMVIFSGRDELSWEDLPEQYKNSPETICEEDYGALYDLSGKDVLIQALNKAGGVKMEAAKLLNITRKTLYNRMKKYNIRDGDACDP